MAIVIFSRPTAFPIAVLRQQLTQDLPDLRWQVGDAETGISAVVASYGAREFISGRNADTMVVVELRFEDSTFPGAPPHGCHLLLSNQGADDPKLTPQVMLSILQGLMRNDEHLARCQLHPGGNWLDLGDLKRMVRFVEAGESIALADGLGTPHGKDPLDMAPPPEDTPEPSAKALPAPAPAAPISALNGIVIRRATGGLSRRPPISFGKRRS